MKLDILKHYVQVPKLLSLSLSFVFGFFVGGGGGLLNGQNLLSVTKVFCRQSLISYPFFLIILTSELNPLKSPRRCETALKLVAKSKCYIKCYCSYYNFCQEWNFYLFTDFLLCWSVGMISCLRVSFLSNQLLKIRKRARLNISIKLVWLRCMVT